MDDSIMVSSIDSIKGSISIKQTIMTMDMFSTKG